MTSFPPADNLLRTLLVLLIILAAVTSASADTTYWQQEVNYRMAVTLSDDLRTIEGRIRIEYINNSPDTLPRIYLKAWPNAIQKGSYADKKRRSQNNYSLASLQPEQEGRLELYELDGGHPYLANGSNHRSFTFDNSLITVDLAERLAPGDSTILAFGFTTVLPKPASMRMGLDRGVVKAVYWFPQACVYDRTMGWVDAQYLGWGENYGDYGSYDVEITAPADMIVAATGVCVNEYEVLPSDLREQLDISNYLKPRSQWPELHLDPNDTKTWHYVAEQVNDFVFTASAHWCIDSDTVDGVQVVAYPLRYKAERWKDAVLHGVQSIETFSDLFMPYQWPVIRICDAYSGMEYPMVTNCRTGAPSPYFPLLIYHEIGHQWFMGMIGSNAIDRPFLDEGFTTHAEHIAMEKYLGRDDNMTYPQNFYERWFGPDLTDRNVRGFRPLLLLMEQGYDKPLVFNYDRGEEYWPWRVSAYYKSAAMHYSFRSILGDSAYFQAMRDYCNRWAFKHPYEDDFKASMEASTGLVLDEYLRQWYYGRERLDYALAGVSVDDRGGQYEHTIKLNRPGDFVAPVDLAVIWEQGDTTFYTVPPEGMAFQKPGYILAPEWRQFRMLTDEYQFTVTAQRRIDRVVVDPDELLMDIDRRNNVAQTLWIVPPLEVRLDNLLYDRVPIDKYALRLRPDIWFDNANGVQLGYHSHGSFLDTRSRHRLDLRWGTRSNEPFADFEFSGPLNMLSKNGMAGQRFMFVDNRSFSSTWYDVTHKPYYSREDESWVRVQVNYLDFTHDHDEISRFDPIPRDVGEFFDGQVWDQTSTVYIHLGTGWISTFRYGSIRFEERALVGRYEHGENRRGFFENNFVARLDLTRNNQTWFSLKGEILNVSGAPPAQFLHHLSRSPAIDRFIHAPVFRSPGTFPVEWEDDFYLAERRVRGYQDRLIYVTESMGGSLELTPPDLIPFGWLRRVPWIGGWLARFDHPVFFDAAGITMDNKEDRYPEPIASNETVAYGSDREWYMSAGLSLRMPPVWDGHQLRVDFPFYLNNPAPGDNEFEFRFSVAWLLTGRI
ncbi:hypothetical protein GF420_14560 [candidate division GN15 bacterium]|nr:hypothetical protein [candidate division GN15 bacterium]